MKTIFLPLGVVLVQSLAGISFAQSSGEVDPAQGKARPTAKTTPSERSEARGERRTEGAEAARGPQMGEGDPLPTAKPKVSAADRKSATEKRRAENRAANKAGELPRGGNADAPERQKP
ncbi:MAG: hypothetical protein EOP82_29490 [Variovorax sp.]|nr:MAG: hypothetical protein EOP82_29490 [Variovorax sp.]